LQLGQSQTWRAAKAFFFGHGKHGKHGKRIDVTRAFFAVFSVFSVAQ
jgi:hypothetical protein